MERQIILITGAAGQLGAILCQRFLEKADVAATWFRRRPTVAAQDQQLVDPLDPKRPIDDNARPVFLVRANLANLDRTPYLVERVLAHYGQIDVLVNAAAFTEWSPLLNGGTLLKSFDRSFRVNVRAPLAIASEIAKQYWSAESVGANAAHNRSVVNISSTAGINLYPGSGQSVYAASKAALNHLTSHMAAEFAELGVRVNALAPNTFPGLVPMDSVVQGVEALVDASDCTGRILVLDESGWSWI